MSVVPNTVPNVGIINYQYQVDPSLPLESDSAQSNLVITTLNNADLVITKKVDKKGADLGDVLLYTLVINNLGNTNANEVLIIDTIPQGTNFIKDSVTVDNIPQPGSNPQTGIKVSNIPSSGVVTITFNVQVYTIPTVNPIPNDANVAYKYTVDPSIVNGKSAGAASNVVTVPVSHAQLANIKGVDREFATIGDTIEYTLTLSNSGNVNATNVILYDTIPADTVFVMNSVLVDGVAKPGVNPQSGIQIGTIKPSQVVKVNFSIYVTTIPSVNPIPNNANVSYNYTVENVGVKSVKSQTNFVNTQINDAEVTGIKSVDKGYANVNDQITYTITLINSGNSKADNVVFYDTIPGDTRFVQNSVIVGGKNQIGVNPQTGVEIGSIGAGASVTISFTVIATTIPAINPIPNSGSANYNFIVNSQTGQTKREGLNTNVVLTTISKAILESFKYVSDNYADVGKEITYTIVFNNKGNVKSNNTVFIDTIPNGTTFVENSVTLNNAIQTGKNPEAGILIGSVYPYQVQTLTFRVLVNTIPVPNPIPNMGTTKYTYTVDPRNPNGATNEILTNTVRTQVNKAILISNKVVDKAYGVIGEVLTYSVGVKNIGNTPANNIVVIDTIPAGTNFIPGSVVIDGITNISANPANGINIGSLNPSQSLTISFKVNALTIPNPNPILNAALTKYEYTVNPSNPNGAEGKTLTNTVKTLISEAIISNPTGGLVKSVDKAYVDLEEELTYSVLLQNKGNTDANNVTVFDTIPKETMFVKDSVQIDGGAAPGENPLTGIYVGTIKPNEQKIVTFKVTPISLPVSNPIKNSADVVYNFTSDPSIINGQTRRYKSNTADSNILSAIIRNEDGGLVKLVDSNYAAIGDIVTYTINLKNTGNTDANNVTVYDAAPEGTEFVANSFMVDGSLKVGVDPTDGYNLGKIVAGGTVVVQFKVKVLQIPLVNPFTNAAEVSYIYTSNPANPNERSQRHFSNKVNTFVNEAIIKNPDGGFVKSVDKAYAVIGDAITYRINLKNTGDTAANNIVVRDTIPNNTQFINGSIIINGNPSTGSPDTGMAISSLPAGASATILFKVRVVTLPTPNPIPNTAVINYTFTSNPLYPNTNTRQYISNTVDTQVNVAKIDNSDGGLIKSVDNPYAKVGDVLTYISELKNTGNVTALSVLFMDSVPSGTSLVPGSVKIEGVSKPDLDPSIGFLVGNIPVKEVVNVSFKVVVNTIPKVNPIQNISQVSFRYIYDPTTGEEVGGRGVSNQVQTLVSQAYIRNSDGGLVKSVSENYAAVGDIVTYTINLTNTGNVPATSVTITDTIPKDLKFIKNSVTVDGIGTNDDPALGISVFDLGPGQQSIVTFQVQVVTIPKPNPFTNRAKVSYRFTKNPAVPNGEFEENLSNIVSTKVNEAIVSNMKYVDKAYADIGDTVTYTIRLNNTGNITAQNTIIFDTIPQGLQFVKDSITINGFTSAGQTPDTGIVVGNIGTSTAVIVSFKAKVISIPKNNPILNFADTAYTFIKNPVTGATENRRASTNTVKTLINHAEISNPSNGLIKSVDKQYADVNENLTYTVKLKNTGNVNANNVVVIDSIPAGTKFVQNSVYVNGENKPSINPENGIFVNSIAPNQVVTISFVVFATEVPVVNPVPNKAVVNYNYTVNPDNIDGVTVENTSNTVVTQIDTADLSYERGGIVKKGSVQYADIGEVIDYTVVLTNKGNVNATNVILVDTLTDSISFTNDSIQVNGNPLTGITPNQGIAIGVIEPGEVVTITFSAKVDSIPASGKVINLAKVNYNYTKDPAYPNGQSKENFSNPFTTFINDADISYETGGLTKVVSKAYADIEDMLTYTFFLKNKGNTIANNIILMDTVPDGMEYISNSATVNGVVIPGAVPEGGILVGNLAPSEIATVSFNVKVVKVPVKNPAKNQGRVSYSYTVNPNTPNDSKATNLSNIAKVQINHGQISNIDGGLVKSANKEYVQIGDTVTYTIFMKDTGNVPTDNVILQDTLPAGTQLVPGSVTLNGNVVLGANPQVGVNVGTIKPGNEVTLKFDVLVVSIADMSLPPDVNGLPCMSAMGQGGMLDNKARVCYRYTVDPSLPCGVTACNQTNIAKVKINTAIINISKGTCPVYVDLGATIDFKLNLSNTGNVLGEQILLKDVLDPSISFVKNSIVINGVSQPGISITDGIAIAPLQPLEKTVVEFKAIVVTTPNKNQIINNASATYTFQLNPVTGERGTGSNTSNQTINYVNHGQLVAVKKVDKAYASGGDVLTYSVSMINKGNVRINNVELVDSIPNDTTLNQGSVMVNGAVKNGAVPQYGIFIGSIDPGKEVDVSYKVTINPTVENSNILNTASANYDYTVDPSVTNGVHAVTVTNTVKTIVNDAIISNETGSFTKTASTDVADVGETYSYTIVAKNIGTVSANNVVIADNLQNSINYVKGTLELNGVQIPDTNLSNGVAVGVIDPGKTVTLKFNVVVVSIPSGGKIDNKSSIQYTYIKDPQTPIEVTTTNYSNDAVVSVTSGVISNFTKVVDKKYVTVGDTVTFTIQGTNTGNIDLKNVIVTDTLISQYTFVKDSVTVNGSLRLSEDIQKGVVIQTVPVGGSFIVTFKAKVSGITLNEALPNVSQATFSYIINQNTPAVTKTVRTNKASVLVREARISNIDGGFEKMASTKFAQIGDKVTFYLSVKNTGNVVATNVLIEDVLQKELSFVVGSIEINSNPEPISNIADGITLGNVNAQEMMIVKFDAIVKAIPEGGIIANKGYVSYKFLVDPNKPAVSKQGMTNEVDILVNSVDIKFVKNSSTDYVAIGDVAVFDFVIRNDGNIPANNVMFIDTIPSGTSFVQNSVVVNGIPVPGVDPTQGISVGILGVGENIDIKFKVSVDAFSSSNILKNVGVITYDSKINPSEAPVKGGEMSNEVDIIVRSPQINITKASNYDVAIVGDSIHYTIDVTNSGNIKVENLLIVDLLASNLDFVEGTVLIGGVNSVSANPSKGVMINELLPAETIQVEFDAIIIPSSLKTATNTATVYYNYYVNPTKAPREGKALSNKNVIDIQNVDVTVTKSANKTVVVLDDTITYRVVIENCGTVSASNVEFVDSLPNTVEVIDGSFSIDGVTVNSVDISAGVNIGTVYPKTQRVIEYTVQVKNVDCSGLVTNYAYALFNANISPDAPVRRVQATPSSLSITAASPRFKEMNVDKVLAIPCQKPDIEEVNEVTAVAEIKDFYVIKTIKGISTEGKRLTGYKLVINGVVSYTVEYTAAVISQSVHSAHYCEKFSSYIIIDEGAIPSPLANVIPEIEDVSWQMLDSRSVFANVTMNVVIK